jgi:hypothetical protein
VGHHVKKLKDAQRPCEEMEGKRETGMGQKDDSDKKEIVIYLS